MSGNIQTALLTLGAISMLAGCEAANGPASSASFELGVNEPDTALPAGFTAIDDESRVPVWLGAQGALMVVGAVRTDAIPAGEKVTIVARFEDAETGHEHARLKFRRALVPGDDGFAYLRDIHLVVGTPETDDGSWASRDAVLTVTIEASSGTFQDVGVLRPQPWIQ